MEMNIQQFTDQPRKNTKELSRWKIPNKLQIPTHVLPNLDGTPKLSKTAEEK
jgi:hypothetical protein